MSRMIMKLFDRNAAKKFASVILCLVATTEVSAQIFWTAVNNGLPANSDLRALAVDSTSGDVFAGIFFGGVFRSVNNGSSWTNDTTGLRDPRVLALAINSDGHIFAGTFNGGVFRSTSNGTNWVEVANLGNSNVLAFAIHATTGHIFAGTSTGAYRSTNNGDNWRESSTGLTNTEVRTLAINTSGDIFAGTAGGVFRSTNNGNSWAPVNVGLTNSSIRTLAISESETIFVGTDAGIFRSANNGNTWTPINAGLTTLGTNALAINAAGIIFAGTIGGGVFRSTNNGDIWAPVNTGLTSLALQALAIASGGFLFAGTADGGAFRAQESTNVGPVLLSISPESGNRMQTLDVVFTGTNLQLPGETTKVNVGDSITVNSLTVELQKVTANLTIRAGAATGPRAFSVTTTGLLGGTSNAKIFTVNNPAPTLTSITPAIGSRLQTLDVVFTGENFISGVSSVNVEGLGITVNLTTVTSSTSLKANLTIAADAATGARDFWVTNSSPGGGESSRQTFTVSIASNPIPTLTGISLNSGNRLQTLDVSFNGTNFISGASSVSFGGDITVNSTTVDNATQITANITIGVNATLGPRDVSVSNASPGGGTATLRSGFTVNNPTPTLTSITPTRGNLGQTLDVDFTGTNFISGVSSVNVGEGITVTSMTVLDQSSLRANLTITSAAATGARNFSVTNSVPGGGKSDSLLFTVNPQTVSLTDISPASGNRLDTLDVFFTGENFINDSSSVNVGSEITVNSTTVISSTSLKANLTITALAATGKHHFSVTNSGPNGGTSESRAFTVNNPKPTLTSIEPRSGGRSQMLEVEFKGTKFFNDASSVEVTGQGITVISKTVPNSTTLRAIITIAADAAPGTRNFSIKNSGPGGGASNNLPFTVTQNNAPVITHAPLSSQPRRVPIQVDAKIGDDSNEVNATLHYRQGGEVDFNSVVMMSSNNDSLFQGTIPENEVTSRGVEYYITATDGALTTRLPVSGIFSIPIELDNHYKQTAQPYGSAQNAYRLISVPFDLDNKSAGAVLEDDLGKYDDTKWRFSELLVDQTYAEFPNTSPLAPGKAFWLIVTEAGKLIDIDDGITNRTEAKYAVALHTQWNFIGNPFNFTIPVQNLSLKSSGLPPDLYFYDGAWNDPAAAQVKELQPFEGYAVYSDAPVDTLFIDPDLSSGATSSPAGHETLWSIRILAQSRQAHDVNNVATVVPAASRARDRMDHPEPPVVGEYVSVYFPHRNWAPPGPGYCTDARPEFSRGEIWEFEVATNIRDKVNLTFEGVAQVPDEFEVWVVDEALKLSQNLRQRNQYAVAGADHPKPLKLVVGRSDFVEERLTGVKVIPTSYELSQNFPNPFNPATTIRYGLPKAESVKVTIYNLLGEKVVTLVEDEPKEAGYHAAIWDGRNQLGQPVASGIFFYRLHAGNFVMTKKMVLVQ